MYKKDNGQISLAEFYTPFGKLDPKNRWARIADMIPWEEYEEKYATQFCEDNGTPAIKFRTAMGTLLIKQRTGHSDEETVLDIMENPYLQYLIGLHEFTTEAPFSASSIINFCKYITKDMINEINDRMFRQREATKEKQDDNDNGDTDDSNGDAGSSDTADVSGSSGNTPTLERADKTEATNEGELLPDATFAIS